MWIHDMIKNQDLKGIRQNVNPDNINFRNSAGETPIEYMILHYDNHWKYNIMSLILQHLMNMGADKTVCIIHIQRCLEDIAFDPSTKKFYQHVLGAKANIKSKQHTNQNRTRTIEPIPHQNPQPNKSQYSTQERLQLERIATKLGIPVQNNHLALKIITQLTKHNICIGCSQNSVICKECLEPQE